MALKSTFVSGLRKTHRSAHTPTDLSHVVLSASAIAPRDLSPSLVFFLPISCSLAYSPSCRLNARLAPSNCCVADITKSPPGSLFSRRQNRRPSPCPSFDRSNVALGHSRSSLNRGPFILTLSYALFFRFLSNLMLPYSTIRHPLISRFTDDITARLRRPTHPYPRSAYLPACHLKNHTIRLSDTRLNLRSFACI